MRDPARVAEEIRETYAKLKTLCDEMIALKYCPYRGTMGGWGMIYPLTDLNKVRFMSIEKSSV